MVMYGTAYGWTCEHCDTSSFVPFSSQDIALADANKHAKAKHGGVLKGIFIVSETVESFEDEDDYENDWA